MMRHRGFTLIELLVVISIVGFLSSIVLASLNQARIKSRDARRIADIHAIRLGLELYHSLNGTYPNCLYAGTANSGDACGTSLEGSTAMSVVPRDPRSGLGYAYAHVRLRVNSVNCASTPTYHLGAGLENQSHGVLDSDRDATSADLANGGRCTAPAYDFYGLSFQSAGVQTCNFYSGDTGTIATETCYDVMP